MSCWKCARTCQLGQEDTCSMVEINAVTLDWKRSHEGLWSSNAKTRPNMNSGLVASPGFSPLLPRERPGVRNIEQLKLSCKLIRQKRQVVKRDNEKAHVRVLLELGKVSCRLILLRILSVLKRCLFVIIIGQCWVLFCLWQNSVNAFL